MPKICGVNKGLYEGPTTGADIHHTGNRSIATDYRPQTDEICRQRCEEFKFVLILCLSYSKKRSPGLFLNVTSM